MNDSPLARAASVPWLVVAALILAPLCGTAAPLREAIPGLFAGALCTTIQEGVCDARELSGLRRFESLSQLLRSSFPAPPIPSASGSFRFAWDPRFDTYSRQSESLGPLFAERAQTLGSGKAIVGFSYSHIAFDTFAGRRLGALSFVEDVFSPAFLARLPSGDRERVESEVLRTTLDLGIDSEAFTLSAAYGWRDDIDLSAILTLGYVHIRGQARSRILDCGADEECGTGAPAGDAFFSAAEASFCRGPTGKIDTKCVTDRFDQSAFGTGDLLLRAKWQLGQWRWLDLASAATFSIPTGNADDFLGFADPTFTPLLIVSKTFGAIAPHANLAYSFRSGRDVGQAQWVAGADLRVLDWLTVASDFLGFHDDHRDGINDDILQNAVGFKINPIGSSVMAASVQFPLNRDGLRADVIYTVQVEQTF